MSAKFDLKISLKDLMTPNWHNKAFVFLNKRPHHREREREREREEREQGEHRDRYIERERE